MADAQIRAVITAQDQASGVIAGFGRSLTSLAAAAGGLVAFDKIVNIGESLVTAFNESQHSAAQLSAVLKSTGDVSGVTAQEATALSESLSKITTFSHEAVLNAENLLLTFTNIGDSIFPRATRATLDMATALGEDTKNSAIQLGKALQDPILGVTALRRVGVAFNETQRETIQNLVNTGQGLEAQKMILAEVEREFGGSAEAIGQTFGGQLKILQNDLHDTQESMGQVISAGFGPLVDGITRFVSTNQELVTSLGVALLAAGAFAGGLVALVGVVGFAVTVLGGPLTIALALIAALLGGIVFKAVQNFQQKMGDATKSVVDGSQKMASDGANNFGATGSAASDLARKLADIKEQMDQTAQDFQQSLASIVQSNEQKVSDIKSQIDDENSAYADSLDQKKKDNDKSLTDLRRQNVLQVGMNADQARTAVAIQQEQVNTQEAQYKEDVQNATDAHNKKMQQLQTTLDQETAFLQKHAADVAAVQNVQILDEIDKLKQSNARQMEAYDKQRDDAIRSAQQTTGGMAAAFNGLPGQISGGLLSGVGTDMGKQMAQALKDSFKDAIRQLPGDLLKWAGDIGSWVAKKIASPAGFNLVAPLLAFHAEGGVFNKPHIGMVAESGPEAIIPLSNPGRAQQVMREAGIGGTSVNAPTININLSAGAFMGTQVEARKYAQTIVNHINDIAGRKNMTGAQLLGAV